MNTLGWLETLWKDCRYALRGFRKSPGFTAVALLSLTLGIGATTAIFSVVYGVLVAPYPYAKPAEIWAPQVRSVKSNQGKGVYSVREFQEIVKLAAFADAMATSPESMLLTGDRTPESMQGALMSAGAFRFLGVEPLVGRTIQPSDIRPSGEAEPVAVMSFLAWQRLFEGNPNAIGQKLRLNGVPYTIIGVMPPRFGWWGNDGVWIPLPTDKGEGRMLFPIMRLNPGVSKQVAEQQLHALHLRLAAERPETYPRDGFRTSLMNYMDITVASGEMRSSLSLLFGAVGFLLLIACANVANLQLARTTARAREIAVRLSIGASRSRLLRQLLTESVLLSVIGGALGVLFAIGATQATVALMPSFYVPNEARITVNVWVLLFSLAVSVLTGILFGLTPAIHSSRPNLTEALKDGARGSGSGSGSRNTRNLLVVTEVALSVILLVGASLAIRGFVSLQRIDAGFQPDRVLMVGVPLDAKRYSTIEQRNGLARELLERVKNLPGVEAVAMGNGGLPFGGPQSRFTIGGQAGADNQRLTLNLISEGYLRTMGIPLRRGRELAEQEVLRGEPVALLNEAAAKLWPAGEDPIGKRVRLDILRNPPGPGALAPTGGPADVMVVGVVGNTRNAGLSRETMPAVLVPYTLLAPNQRMLAVRTHAAPLSLLNAVRQQVQAIDKEQPLARPITLDEVLGSQTIQPRFNMALFSFFAAVGLILAAAGIYSVISYHVTRRTHEIGVRVALGAKRRDVITLVLDMGGKLVALGLAVGLLGSYGLAKTVRTQIFQTTEMDAASSLAVVAVLSGVALLACYVPARRAARLDPLVALRQD